jgi:hypothetical protein
MERNNDDIYNANVIRIFNGRKKVHAVRFNNETYIVWPDLNRALPAQFTYDEMKTKCPLWNDVLVKFHPGRTARGRLIVPESYINLFYAAAQRKFDRQERLARNAPPPNRVTNDDYRQVDDGDDADDGDDDDGGDSDGDEPQPVPSIPPVIKLEIDPLAINIEAIEAQELSDQLDAIEAQEVAERAEVLGAVEAANRQERNPVIRRAGEVIIDLVTPPASPVCRKRHYDSDDDSTAPPPKRR